MSDASPTITPPPTRAAARVWWLLLLLAYLLGGVTFSLVQPLGGPLDESAHLRVVRFLAEEHRLPVWNNANGGEAGFEDQHPPLCYGVLAGIYALARPLGDTGRWYLLRWVDVLLGLLILGVCRRFFAEALPAGSPLVWYATAGVALLPAFLYYASHVNPDLWVMLWVTLALLFAQRIYHRPGDLRLALWLGVICGLGTMTKLSAAPALVLALLVEVWPVLRGDRAALRGVARTVAITLGVWLLLCGWWFVRNELVSGVLVPISTPQHQPSAIHEIGYWGLPHMIRLTLLGTYLSTPVPLEWPPAGSWSTVYGSLSVLLLLGVLGLLRRGPGVAALDGRLRVALKLSGLAFILLLAAQQWSYWMQDVSKNMGGRYLLAVVPALTLLVAVGVSRWRRLGPAVLPAWIGLLLIINVTSAWNIVHVLNPQYNPGWHLLK